MLFESNKSLEGRECGIPMERSAERGEGISPVIKRAKSENSNLKIARDQQTESNSDRTKSTTARAFRDGENMRAGMAIASLRHLSRSDEISLPHMHNSKRYDQMSFRITEPLLSYACLGRQLVLPYIVQNLPLRLHNTDSDAILIEFCETGSRFTIGRSSQWRGRAHQAGRDARIGRLLGEIAAIRGIMGGVIFPQALQENPPGLINRQRVSFHGGTGGGRSLLIGAIDVVLFFSLSLHFA
jgi:hypothetical protein